IDLHHAFAEAFEKFLGEIERHLFRADDDQARRTSLLRLSLAQIRSQESRCRQQNRDFVILDQGGVLRCFERTWISDYWRALDERIPEGDGTAETVEKGERGKKTVVRPGIEHDGKLGDVADDIMMRKNDAFGFAGAATGKKQDCFFVAAVARKAEPAS